MAERPSSPGPRKPGSKRSSVNPQNRGSGTTRARAQHGTPFKPNPASSMQNGDPSRRGGHGRSNRGSSSRGQARNKSAQGQNTATQPPSPFAQALPSTQTALKTKPSTDEVRQADLDREHLAQRREKVHARYVGLRKTAIENKLMDDPDRPKALSDSIRRVGICQQMCDEKERVDRIFENLVDPAETEPHPETRKPVPIEGKMVKRFRRAAAGDPDQQLEELRTPSTLRKTMDYLIRDVISLDSRLPQVHKFVWDRTRAIRNDFTIQGFYDPENVRHEVDCYERIARFHIVSMHQMVNPDYVRADEHYDGQQDLEQLNKTILTLLTKYDDFRHVLDFPNEAEFRAYFILIEMRNSASDIEDRVQRWPRHVFGDGRVQTALKLYSAACSTDQRYGTLGTPIPVALAQANSGRFWSLLDSLQVSYLMACTAEMSFFNVRFTALNALWAASKNASKSNQASLRFWTKPALEHYLGFDYDEQAADFCTELGLSFATKADPRTGHQEEFLDFTANDVQSLDKSLLSMSQIFSDSIVERKRHRRTLFAVISGMSVAEARRAGHVETPNEDADNTAGAKQHRMFLSDDDEEHEDKTDDAMDRDGTSSRLILDPKAAMFVPQTLPTASTSSPPQSVQQEQPRWMTHFGQTESSDSTPSAGFPGMALASAKKSAPEPFLSSPFGSTTSVPIFHNKSQSSDATPSKLPGLQSSASSTSKSHFGNFTSDNPFGTNNHDISPEFPNASSNGNASHPFTSVNPLSKPQDQINPPRKINPLFTFDAPASTGSPTFQIPEPLDRTGTSSFATAPPTTSLPSDTNQTSLDSRPATQQNLPQFHFTSPSTSHASTEKHDPSNIDQPFSSSPNQKSGQSSGAFFSSTTIDSQPLTSTASLQTQTQPAKPPSIESIKFPSATNKGLQFDRTDHKLQSLANTTDQAPRQASISPSTQPIPPQCHPPSAELTPFPPVSTPTPAEKAADPEQLVHELVRLGLVQTDGIIDMFVSHKISTIVRSVFDRFRRSQVDERITTIRQQVLRRKYFVLWKNIAETRRLRKQASRRRARLAASMKADAEKHRRKVLELEQIVEADRISQRIRREQRRMKLMEELKEKNQKEKSGTETEMMVQDAATPTLLSPEKASTAMPAPLAGQKRKSPANGVVAGTLNEAATGSTHKRSRTLGGSSQTPSFVSFTSDFERDDWDLRRPMRSKSLRQLADEATVDKTRTDYFRLIAYGIDPNTLLNPMTQKQVDEQQKRQAEKKANTILRVTKGRGRNADAAKEVLAQLTATEEPLEEVQSENANTTVEPRTPYNPEDDPLIKQIRETKQQLADDAKWFKEQTAVLAQEIEQQDELRRSFSQSQSTEGSFGVSVNGFARSLNGYEYVPPILKPGETLSRTEQRIRQTGAYGLATKRIGGTRTGSTPVAMSKKSALHYIATADREDQVNGPRKRSVGEFNRSNGLDSHAPATQPIEARMPLQEVVKKPRTDEVPQSSSFGYIVTTDHTSSDSVVQDAENDNDGDYEAEEDVEEGEESYESDKYFRQPEAADDDDEDDEAEDDDDEVEAIEEEGDFQDEEDEEDEELEGDEGYEYESGQQELNQLATDDYGVDGWQEDESDEEEDDDLYAGPYGYGLRIPPTFSRHGSQALSGVGTPDTGAGASVDDAIELSD